MTDQATPTDLDAARDSSTEVRLCVICHRPLPLQTGRGRRWDYCPEGTGPYEQDPAIRATCKDIAGARRLYEAWRGVSPIPDADLDRLGEQHAAVITALEVAQEPITALRAQLTELKDQHAERVQVAEAERDAAREAERVALGEKTEAEREREIAVGQAEQAIAEQRAAEADRDQAHRERATAVADRDQARHQRARAEGEAKAQARRALDAEKSAARDRERAQQAVARAGATVSKLRAQLRSAEDRRTAAEDRCKAAETAAAAEIARITADAEGKIAQARAEARDQVAAAITRVDRITQDYQVHLARQQADQLHYVRAQASLTAGVARALHDVRGTLGDLRASAAAQADASDEHALGALTGLCRAVDDTLTRTDTTLAALVTDLGHADRLQLVDEKPPTGAQDQGLPG